MNSTAPGPASAPSSGNAARPAPAQPEAQEQSTPHSAVCTPVLPPRIRIPLPALELYCGPVRYRTAPVELVAEPMECERVPEGKADRGDAPCSPQNAEHTTPPASGSLPSSIRHAPSSLPPRPFHFSLRKGLGVWHLIFAGQEAVLRHERGLLYVAWLLQHPPAQPLHAIDLVAQIPALYRAQLGLGTLAAGLTHACTALPSEARLQERSLGLDDAQALRALRRKEQELEAILDDESESEPVKAEALRELEAIAQFLRQHGQRSRDAAERTVHRVRQSIQRLHARVAAARDAQAAPHPVLRPFAEHLQRYLLVPSGRYALRGNRFTRTGLAGCFTYEPPPGVVWNR